MATQARRVASGQLLARATRAGPPPASGVGGLGPGQALPGFAARSSASSTAELAPGSPRAGPGLGQVRLGRADPILGRAQRPLAATVSAPTASRRTPPAGRWPPPPWRPCRGGGGALHLLLQAFGGIGTAMICDWPTLTVAAKESRSRPSQRDASGVPSMISSETSRPSATSTARQATLPARSWLMSMVRPSSSPSRASTSQRSAGQGRGVRPAAARRACPAPCHVARR